jgi:hypothetical protein
MAWMDSLDPIVVSAPGLLITISKPTWLAEGPLLYFAAVSAAIRESP